MLSPDDIRDRVAEYNGITNPKRKLRVGDQLNTIREETAVRLETGWKLIKDSEFPSSAENYWADLLGAYEEACDALDTFPELFDSAHILFDAQVEP